MGLIAVSYSPPPAHFVATSRTPSAPWRRTDRLVVALAGGLLLVPVAIALCLPPSPSGLGTHQQLGLPPCTLLDWYGIRCPSCGMTTAWCCLVRGQIVPALRANVGGALLGLAAAIGGPWLVVSGVCSRWVGGFPRDGWIIAAATLILTLTLVQWTVRLSLGW